MVRGIETARSLISANADLKGLGLMALVSLGTGGLVLAA